MDFEFKDTSDSLAWDCYADGVCIGRVCFDELNETYRQSADRYMEEYETRIAAAEALQNTLG